MGRGRAKAKQTKVARDLKYFSPDTDFSSLERELHRSTTSDSDATTRRPEITEDDDDDYGKWVPGGR